MLNRITVQLPVEGLLFWKLSGREAMSESFALTLTVLGTDARIDRTRQAARPAGHGDHPDAESADLPLC